jgi:hypothetical protein
MWLDAADTTTLFQDTGLTVPVSANTQAVGGWKDKSGNARNMTRSAGTVTKSNVAGYDVVDIPSGSIMTTTSAITLVGGAGVQTGSSFFIVAELLANPASLAYMIGHTNITGGDYSVRANGTGASFALFNENGDYDAGRLTYNVNGLTTNSFGNRSLIDGYYFTGGTTQVTLSTAFLSRFAGERVSEVLIYTGTITGAQRFDIQGYLAWKWGLQSLLPSSHTYSPSQGAVSGPLGIGLSTTIYTVGTLGSDASYNLVVNPSNTFNSTSNLRITGNVGIGTPASNAASYPLDVYGQGRMRIIAQDVSLGTTLTSSSTPAIVAGSWGTYYNLLRSDFSGITLPSQASTENGAFFVFRNNTSGYITPAITYTNGSGLGTSIAIPPSNAATVVWTGTKYVLF